MDNSNIGFMDTSKWGLEQPSKPKSAPKPTSGDFHLWKLYNKNKELLFVTKNPNQQFLIKEDWFGDVVSITVEHYGNAEDLSAAKIAAITDGKPKWNSRVTG
jgi:hypothetical protein